MMGTLHVGQVLTFLVYDYVSEENAYNHAYRAAFDWGLHVYDAIDAAGEFVGYEVR